MAGREGVCVAGDILPALCSMVKARWATLRVLNTTPRWTDTLGGFKVCARCQNYQG